MKSRLLCWEVKGSGNQVGELWIKLLFVGDKQVVASERS